MQAHIAEKNIIAGTIGDLMRASDQGILVNANLSSATAAKSAIDTAVAKLHTSEKTSGAGPKAAIDLADQFVTNYTTGTNVAAIETALPNQKTRGRRTRF
jgi:hypothetical protein